ncbi:MAG: hypothetical protein ACO1NN_05550 [Sphingopyxis sp.]
MAAYQMTDTKRTHLAIAAGAFFMAALAWLVFQARLDATWVFSWLLVALPIVTVSVVAMMLRERGSVLDAEPKQNSRNWRKNMILNGRDLAVRYTNDKRQTSFRDFLETSSLYPHLRSHLSKDYLDKLNAPRTAYTMNGGKYEPLVVWFLDELDRLEQEWHLR